MNACNLGSYLKTDVGISTKRYMGALQFTILSVIAGVLTMEAEHSLALIQRCNNAIYEFSNRSLDKGIIYR